MPAEPEPLPLTDSRRRATQILYSGMLVYLTTSLMVVIGAIVGVSQVPLCQRHPDSTGVQADTFAGKFAPWDGVWYRQIVQDGYTYKAGQKSSVAFFPLYPASSWVVKRLTGMHVEYALLLTSNLYLAGACMLFVAYLSGPMRGLSVSDQRHAWIALGLFPTTFYMRMSYTESSFLFVTLLAMYAMQRNWCSPWIALIIGLATAGRTVGISLLLPFAWHIWCQNRNPWAFVKRSAWLLPLASWGLLAYMAYQWSVFGEPLAFVKTQVDWYEFSPPNEWWLKAWVHLTLEPLWQVYLPDCPCYWGNDPPRSMLLSMQFANPLIVLFTWATIGIGAYRRQLTAQEVSLCVGLLAIPYLTHAYRGCCVSEARYASVVFPFYIMLGHWLGQCPRGLSRLIYLVFAVYLSIYSALFVSWYWVY